MKQLLATLLIFNLSHPTFSSEPLAQVSESEAKFKKEWEIYNQIIEDTFRLIDINQMYYPGKQDNLSLKSLLKRIDQNKKILNTWGIEPNIFKHNLKNVHKFSKAIEDCRSSMEFFDANAEIASKGFAVNLVSNLFSFDKCFLRSDYLNEHGNEYDVLAKNVSNIETKIIDQTIQSDFVEFYLKRYIEMINKHSKFQNLKPKHLTGIIDNICEDLCENHLKTTLNDMAVKYFDEMKFSGESSEEMLNQINNHILDFNGEVRGIEKSSQEGADTEYINIRSEVFTRNHFIYEALATTDILSKEIGPIKEMPDELTFTKSTNRRSKKPKYRLAKKHLLSPIQNTYICKHPRKGRYTYLGMKPKNSKCTLKVKAEEKVKKAFKEVQASLIESARNALKTKNRQQLFNENQEIFAKAALKFPGGEKIICEEFKNYMDKYNSSTKIVKYTMAASNVLDAATLVLLGTGLASGGAVLTAGASATLRKVMSKFVSNALMKRVGVNSLKYAGATQLTNSAMKLGAFQIIHSNSEDPISTNTAFADQDNREIKAGIESQMFEEMLNIAPLPNEVFASLKSLKGLMLLFDKSTFSSLLTLIKTMSVPESLRLLNAVQTAKQNLGPEKAKELLEEWTQQVSTCATP